MTSDAKWIVGTGVAVIASVGGSAVAVLAVMVTLVGGVREDLRGVRGDVRDLRGELLSLRNEVNARLDGFETRLDGLDTRLRNVEIAFGKVDQRLLTLERVLLPPREPAGE